MDSGKALVKKEEPYDMVYESHSHNVSDFVGPFKFTMNLIFCYDFIVCNGRKRPKGC